MKTSDVVQRQQALEKGFACVSNVCVCVCVCVCVYDTNAYISVQTTFYLFRTENAVLRKKLEIAETKVIHTMCNGFFLFLT